MKSLRVFLGLPSSATLEEADAAASFSRTGGFVRAHLKKKRIAGPGAVVPATGSLAVHPSRHSAVDLVPSRSGVRLSQEVSL
jgi:uncharacterized membrane protein